MRYNRNHTKGIAMILCFAMLFSTMATTVFAMGPEESVDTNLTIEQMEKPSSDVSLDAGNANIEFGGQETDKTQDNSEKGEPDSIIEIASFLPLDEEVANQIVPDEAALETFALPQTLTGTNGQGETVEIPVTWEREPVFDPDDEEALIGYSYTPVLPEGYVLAEGVELPTIQVAVMEAATNNVGEDNVIEVSGETMWSAIQAQIDVVLASNPDTPITISGTGDGAVIKMDVVYTDDNKIPELGAALELHSDTTFENVTFQLQGQSSTNTQPNIAMFANGHKLHIADDVKTERVGDYSKSMHIFGGSRTEAIKSTHVEVCGGTWARIYGGSYRSNCVNTYIYVGGNTDVRDVYGGCFGAKTTGNIEIKYGSAANDHTTVMGGGHDVQNGEQIADVTGEKIEIEILPGALLAEVNGAVNSMISCDDVYITVDDGARVLTSVSGGATTSSAKDWSLASGYNPGGTQYIAESDIHVVFNGEGRRDDTKLYSASVTGGGIWGHVRGNIDVTINGNVEYVYGGSHNGNITGNINTTINGGVYAGGHNADMEIGEVYDWYGGTVTSGCIDGTVIGNITTTINKDAEVHAVIGGSDDGGVVGNTTVHVYGTILKENYESANRFLSGAGCVFGGGYLGSSSCIDTTDVSGKTNVYIYEGSDVQGDVYGGGLTARCSGGTNVVVSGTVRGDVYGGSWLHESGNDYYGTELGYVGDTSVELNGNGSANHVYGGGRIGSVRGGSIVILKDNAEVNNVYGTGNAYTTFYHNGREYTFGPIAISTGNAATVRVQDEAVVADTIYGYEVVEIENANHKLLTGRAEVYFEQSDNNSVFKRVENADLVHVTDNSKVEIDNAHQNDEQLVNVYDLTIDDSSTLRLGASAHILGNYQGDATMSGTLEIPAKRLLFADGTVTMLTRISIYDHEYDGLKNIPEKWDIYVTSGEGSTTADGDFSWIDTRNSVYMAWTTCEDAEAEDTNHTCEEDQVDVNKLTHWWLINDPESTRHGSLTVTKEVAGEAGEQEREFTFTVTCTDAKLGGESGMKFGEMTFVNGEATFTLKHGARITADNLPAGIAYVVTEDDYSSEGYETAKTGDTGTIKGSTAVTAAFVNTKNVAPPDPTPETGSLTVSKTVAGNAGETDKDFHFTVTLGDRNISGIYGDMTFESGEATFDLKHGESKTAAGLPVDMTYTVVEDDYSSDGYTTASTGESGTIREAGVTASFLNTKNVNPPDPGPKTGDLMVSKTVSGNRGDTSKDFSFTVTLGDTSIDGKYGDMTFHDGVAAFTLRHGQSMKASGLPAGIRYTVAESDNAGYTVTSSGETGSIMAGETAVALFNNHMSGGDSGNDDVDVSVKKVWKLDDGGKAADAVTAVLLRDGKEYQRVELNEQNGWTYTWTGLSDKYTWSVSEVNVPDGFTMKVEQNGNVWTITNDDKPITPPDPTDPDKPTNPDKPTEPTTPSKPDKPKDDTPQTGDESNLILWLALLGISGMGVMVTLLFSKRKYRGKHSKR